MSQKIVVTLFTFALFVLSAGAESAPGKAKLSAAEIVEKNMEARGGLQAWRQVQSLSMTGKLAAGGDQRGSHPIPLPDKRAGKLVASQRLAEEAQLPFVLKMERPRKVRLELQFKGRTAVQVYDGTNGWKVRPYLNRGAIETFSPDELRAASLQPDLDGPLVDYIVKGTQVELVGVENVENHDTYNLKLTMKGGQTSHVWIDAQTFLEAKIEGQPRRLDGMEHAVELYYRDFREVSGVRIPFVLETKVLPATKKPSQVGESAIPVERIVIERVVVNPKLDPYLFTKPAGETALNLHE